MQATTGDEIIVRGHHVGMADRRGVIVDVRGEGGAPPYMVRWSDGREDLFFPSSDASISRAASGERQAQAPPEQQIRDEDRAGEERDDTMSVGKRKQKRTMSRDEAARLFATLGSAFSGTDEVTIDVDGETVTLGSPSEIDVELEVKSSHRKSELELEMKWSHAAAEA